MYMIGKGTRKILAGRSKGGDKQQRQKVVVDGSSRVIVGRYIIGKDKQIESNYRS